MKREQDIIWAGRLFWNGSGLLQDEFARDCPARNASLRPRVRSWPVVVTELGREGRGFEIAFSGGTTASTCLIKAVCASKHRRLQY
jgi:hypothetical protein